MNQDGAKRLVKDYEHMNHHIIQSAGHQLIFDNPKDVTDKLIEVINHWFNLYLLKNLVYKTYWAIIFIFFGRNQSEKL